MMRRSIAIRAVQGLDQLGKRPQQRPIGQLDHLFDLCQTRIGRKFSQLPGQFIDDLLQQMRLKDRRGFGEAGLGEVADPPVAWPVWVMPRPAGAC